MQISINDRVLLIAGWVMGDWVRMAADNPDLAGVDGEEGPALVIAVRGSSQEEALSEAQGRVEKIGRSLIFRNFIEEFFYSKTDEQKSPLAARTYLSVTLAGAFALAYIQLNRQEDLNHQGPICGMDRGMARIIRKSLEEKRLLDHEDLVGIFENTIREDLDEKADEIAEQKRDSEKKEKESIGVAELEKMFGEIPRG